MQEADLALLECTEEEFLTNIPDGVRQSLKVR